MFQNKYSSAVAKQDTSSFELCTLCNKNERNHNDLCTECDEKIEMRANSLNNEKIISGKYEVIQNMARFVNKHVFNNSNYNYSDIINVDRKTKHSNSKSKSKSKSKSNTNSTNNDNSNSDSDNNSSDSDSVSSPIQLSQSEFGSLMNKIHPILVCILYCTLCILYCTSYILHFC